MATNDDMGEVNAQERTQVIAGAEQPTANHNIRMAGGEHLRSRDMAQQLDVKELSAITAPAMEYQELAMPPSLPPNVGFEEMSNTNFASQLNAVAGADGNDHTATEHLDTLNNQHLYQGIPYSAAQTSTANNHEHHQSAPGMDDGHQTDQTAQDQQENETASDVESDEADEPVQSHQRRGAPDEHEEGESGDGEYSDDDSHDSEDEDADEDDEEDIAEFQSKLKRSVAQRAPNSKSSWDRRHELFQAEDDGDVQEVPRQEFHRNLSGQPRIKQEPVFAGYGGPQQAQQPPLHAYDPRTMAPFSGGMLAAHQASPFMSASQPGIHQNRSMTNNGYQMPPHMSAAPNAPHHFSPGFPYDFNGPQGQQAMSFQDPRFPPYGQGPLQSAYTALPMSPYETHGQGFAPPPTHPPPNHVQPPARDVATVHNIQQRGSAKRQVSEEDSSASDDEPLRTRTKRHPSKVNDAVGDSSTPAPKSVKRGKQQKQESDSDVEEVLSQVKTKPMMGFKIAKATKAAAAPKKSAASAQPAQPTQPTQAQPEDPAQASQPTIDWKLPRYEAIFEPPKTKDDPTVARVSLPKLVREELLLSLDHASQEAHLLLHIFLPAHQALSTPDPEPAIAVLNFHTIALMVIEAFVQFEIGDEYGTGRGHWHNAHDQSDVDYLRQRPATDADTEEIFFAVIDRWRAGIESGKESAKMIRGVQEFCDVALDVIYYIKEHGLLKERKNAWQEKGNKKGAKKVEEEDSEEGFGAVAKGKKRGAQVNEVNARKKPKTGEKAKSKAKSSVSVKPAKKKTSIGGVTVMRAKR